MVIQFHEARTVWYCCRAEPDENGLIFQAIVELRICLWLFSYTQVYTQTLEKRLLVQLYSISRKEERCTLVQKDL